MDKVHSEVWTEDLFGEGVNLGYDRVKIPQVDSAAGRDAIPSCFDVDGGNGSASQPSGA